MALVRAESFDYLTTQAQLNTVPGWTTAGTITLETTAGKRSSGNIRITGSNGCNATLSIPSARPSGVANFAFSTDSVNTTYAYIRIMDGATVHLEMQVNASGQLEIRRGSGGTVIATGTTVIAINTYYHVQLKFTINNTTGFVEMILNSGSSPELTFSGDTQNGGSAQWSGLNLRGQELNANSPFIRFDDIVLLDDVDQTATHGIPNNDYIGEVRVDALIAQAGNGNSTGLTPSTGSDHGALVDETTPNDDTDYNSGVSVGDKDTYTLPSMPYTPTQIFAVLAMQRTKKTDAGARDICNVLRSGGTDYDDANQSLSTSYAYYVNMHESDPDTGAPWDPSAITALEVGSKVTV